MPRPHAVCRQSTVTRASRSKARLLDEPNRRASWRSHVHCTYIAQRVQLFKIETGNVTFLLRVQGGDSLSRKRITPLIRGSATGAAIPTALCAESKKEGRAFAQPPSYAGLAAAAVIAATAVVAAAAIVVAAATAAAAAGEDQDDEDQDPQAAAAAKTTVIIAHKTNPL